MKWHDPAETVMGWNGLYDGWVPIYRAAPRGAVLAKLGGPDGHCDDKPH